MGELIHLFPNRQQAEAAHPATGRRCDDCEHAMFGSGGITCRQYSVDVDAKEAEQCEGFKPTPWASKGTGETPCQG